MDGRELIFAQGLNKWKVNQGLAAGGPDLTPLAFTICKIELIAEAQAFTIYLCIVIIPGQAQCKTIQDSHSKWKISASVN